MDLQLQMHINPVLLDSVVVSPLLSLLLPTKRSHRDDVRKLTWKVFKVDGLGYFRDFGHDREVQENKLVAFSIPKKYLDSKKLG